jgi:hypothetical protein
VNPDTKALSRPQNPGSPTGRAASYSKTDFRLDTSSQSLEGTFEALHTMVR